MKEKLLKNWGFKILALLLGFVIWFLVANVEDYSISKTITGIPVTLLNQEAITDQNKVFEVTQGETVNITVQGRRSIVEGLTADDFNATADLSELSITNAVQVAVEAHSVEIRREVAVTVNDGMLMVAIEDSGEEKFPITVATKGTPQEGYAVISTSSSPTTITVTGAASLIKKITNVQAEVDVDEGNGNISVQSKIKLIDSYGEEIDASKLQLSAEVVRARAYIQKTKEVPIVVTAEGEPAEGYGIAGDPQYDTETILVAGTETNLRNLSSILIDDIDVTDRDEDLHTTVNIGDYLPSGITIIDPIKTIDITIPIEKLVEKTITLRPANIEVVGKQDDYDYKLPVAENEFEITVVGLSKDVENMTAADLEAYIDVSELKSEGAYNIRLQLKELSDVNYVEDVTDLRVALTIEEKATTEEEDSSSTTESSSTTVSSSSTSTTAEASTSTTESH